MIKYNTAAQAELARKTADKYFPTNDAITTPPEAAPQQETTSAPAPSQVTRMTKLSELAAALNDIPKQVEADAEAALNRLIAAKEKASNATSRIHDVAGKIEAAAAEIEDFTNQITNGGPPLAS